FLLCAAPLCRRAGRRTEGAPLVADDRQVKRMVEARFVAALLASGGDGRIELRSGANTNQYGASPFPRSVRAYASSTANDVALAAFEHLHDVLSGWPQDFAHSPDFYRASLEQLRARIRQSWMLADDVEIAFAASGTDLEYLPL